MRVLAVVVAVLVVGGLGAVPVAAAPGAERSLRPVVVTGAFEPGGTTAVTYDPRVPAGADVAVFAVSGLAGTVVLLATHGLLPGRAYGAHVHVAPCGATPAAAGPHFQHRVDPVSPSVDPRYANPRNELWLDFTADRAGNGFAHAAVHWSFGDRRPGSVVIHETHTHTGEGHAGTAGARLACVTVPF